MSAADNGKAKKSYGHLAVVCGPMFSGKTTELLKNILWAKNGLSRNVEVFKTSFDDRYAHEEIVSHEGLQTKAMSIKKWIGIKPETDIVFFDEVQFFCDPQFKGDITQIVPELLEQGVDVFAAGLDMDFQGRPFPVTAHLLAMADQVQKLQSICSVCGQPATKSYRKSQSRNQVELGGVELYEPRCTKHWTAYDDQADLFAVA